MFYVTMRPKAKIYSLQRSKCPGASGRFGHILKGVYTYEIWNLSIYERHTLLPGALRLLERRTESVWACP